MGARNQGRMERGAEGDTHPSPLAPSQAGGRAAHAAPMAMRAERSGSHDPVFTAGVADLYLIDAGQLRPQGLRHTQRPLTPPSWLGTPDSAHDPRLPPSQPQNPIPAAACGDVPNIS